MIFVAIIVIILSFLCAYKYKHFQIEKIVLDIEELETVQEALIFVFYYIDLLNGNIKKSDEYFLTNSILKHKENCKKINCYC
jgi:hypothetical protein